MSIRRRNRKTSNRKDGSTAQFPIPTPVTATPIAGGIRFENPAGLQLNANPDSDIPTTDITLNNSAGSFTGNDLIATQVDPYTVDLTGAALSPGTFSGTLNLGPANTGIRGARGGGILVIPDVVFP